jgi:hypothetical protein
MKLIHTKDKLIFFWKETHGIIYTDLNENPINWYHIGDKEAELAYKKGEFSKSLDEGLFNTNKHYKLTLRSEIDEEFLMLKD